MPSGVIYAKYSEQPTGLSSHYHDCNQLLFVTEGEAEITIGDSVYPATRGSLVIISRFEKHAVRVKSGTYRRYIVRIGPKREENSRLSGDLFSLLINRRPGFHNAVSCREDAAAVEACFAALAAEYGAAHPFREEMLDALLQTVLVQIARRMPDAVPVAVTPAALAVRTVQKRLEDQYGEPHTLEELAAEVHLNPYYLSHLFKKETGQSVFGYLQACRLAAAKYQLTHTALPIGRILDLCGFTDPGNFSRLFKSAVGCTPTEFRARYSG